METEWQVRFPEFTRENLQSHGVIDESLLNFVWVHKRHPVFEMLENNDETRAHTLKLVDNQYIKLSRRVFEYCCNTLIDYVFDGDDNDVSQDAPPLALLLHA